METVKDKQRKIYRGKEENERKWRENKKEKGKKRRRS